MIDLLIDAGCSAFVVTSFMYGDWRGIIAVVAVRGD